MKYIATKGKVRDGIRTHERNRAFAELRVKPLHHTHKTSRGRSGSNRKVIER